MTERITTVPLDHVRPHPDNPRLNAVADAALVESIRLHGLVDPVLVAPDPEDEDRYVLLDGARRYDGHRQAAATEIRVRVREDLVTQAQQIEVMAITGLQKELLSPVEEARAYEQLQLIGYNEAAIAAAVGYSKARVKQRLRLGTLPEHARTSVHLGQVTLSDVEAFHEFADDAEATAKLDEALGTDDFTMTVNALRSRRQRIAHNADLVAQFIAAGARAHVRGDGALNLSIPSWEGTELAETGPHQDAGCLGYAAFEPDSFHEPRLVCLEPRSHETTPSGDGPASAISAPVVATEGDVAAAQEAEAAAAARRAAEAEAAEQQTAADRARLDWLYDHFVALFPVKGNATLVSTLAGVLPGSVWHLDDRAVLDALEQDAPGDWRACEQAVRSALADLATAKPARILRAFARITAAQVAESLTDELYDDRDLGEHAAQLAGWDWLAEAGYPLPSLDRDRHTALRALVDRKRTAATGAAGGGAS
ncbi:ParB/RepB/Spo0J family partition protein [Pimelobacter simplex]|uniref:ParB/RepB/Spo0J family partition protein n=1 Tax=Nocardioides simplex TaxID=2045 RepID=UPI00214FC952|nr:ParB/RepB/Spo0J family partition protein [Pimelobacter simplex]UUW88357.1 ParB/RepB/Spo0J family partition protein [Pimelobacter simplex]UUW97861.1 ParB/RepB/Spo0J family partition protein [Pimelobacter simplex]